MSGAGREAVLASTDAGTSWADVTPAGLTQQSTTAVISNLNAVDAAHAWVTVGGVNSDSRPILLATTDSGRHWARRAALPRGGCDVQFAHPVAGLVYRQRRRGRLGDRPAVSDRRRGRRWRLVSQTGVAGTAQRSTPGALPYGCDKAITFRTPRQGWALFTCAGGSPLLYRSTDAGATWSPVTVAAPNPAVGGLSGTPVFAGRLGVVPFTIGWPRQTLIYRTVDGGRSWRPVTPPGPARGWLAYLRTPSSWRLVSGRQVLSTDDAGQTWRRTTMDHDFGRLSTGFGFPETGTMTFVDSTTAVINARGLWRTTDGGQHWHQLAVPGT